MRLIFDIERYDRIGMFKKYLVLTETDPSKIESIFKDIAKNLLNNFVIRNGDKLYRMVEIEFYYT